MMVREAKSDIVRSPTHYVVISRRLTDAKRQESRAVTSDTQHIR